MSTDTITSGWQADPTGRHELRYHDGTRWTEHVADGGVQDTDPYDAPAPQTTGAATAWPTPPAARPDAAGGTAPTASGSSDPGTAWTGDGEAAGAGAPTSTEPAATAAWPTGDAGGGGAPDWSAVPPPGPGSSAGSGSSSRSSTGRRVVLVLVVLVLMAVSAVGGFVAGLAVDVGDAIDEGLSVGGVGRADLDGAVSSGVVLSRDTPRFEGSVDGPTAFTVEVAQAGQVALEVEDADFDTYLTLYDADGEVVADDDDSGTSGSLLSRIDTPLAPGTYTLVLDSWSGGIDPGTTVVVTADIGLG